ncbi:hypothetical protein JH271_20460 [Xanthomonas campestris pv. campestris]|uniref:hypothetical protein n=1 Tax=Xanthomonas campestris TaxID=339 RepID=UPI00021AF265|nr:hypothetical protein [Xanthomonas campestris]AEL05059.1 conserved hypothetical protein [Xanthomonas campestris pv. raphani 756C]MCC5098849.1 hypothetical protein [Xanthomonas campestris]MCC8485880.1 hypothetical protein [Xanthomonas campestris]MDX6083295.1 hypothetical protein [Xanthomonas campestris pv. incanae]MDX6087010.1 hypothetical protein [Xanthomonas campestris pv. incanae]
MLTHTNNASDTPTAEAHDSPVSLFRQTAAQRRQADAAALQAADYDQKPWGLLYRALTDAIGATPETFQMVYPFTTWAWPVQQAGFIGTAQYDFCSTSPQWSAVGAFVSSGDRLNQAYQEFLNVIPAATDDASLRQKIKAADDALTAASNGYTIAYNQARSVYQDDVTDNDPTFTKWLGSPAGAGWQNKISSMQVKMDQAQLTYNALVVQANTPGLGEAQKQMANENFYAKLNDPALSKFPLVPNWSVAQSASEWIDAVQAGQGPAGATMGFTNRDAAYDYSKTWAGGSAKIRQLFWEVRVAGKWQRIDEFETDNELDVSVEFEALDLIQIQPSDWYNGPFVRSKANGPFVKGYSAFGEDGTQAVFGEKGFFGLLKTGMYVGYKPTFTITTSKSSFSKFSEMFKVSTGLRIGPFTFEAEGGSEKAGWSLSESGQSFTGTTTSEQPLIVGIAISKLPQE